MASRLPTRKAELVALIQERLEDPASLRQLWEELDPLQQAAVAEVVHSPAPYGNLAMLCRLARLAEWPHQDKGS